MNSIFFQTIPFNIFLVFGKSNCRWRGPLLCWHSYEKERIEVLRGFCLCIVPCKCSCQFLGNARVFAKLPPGGNYKKFNFPYLLIVSCFLQRQKAEIVKWVIIVRTRNDGVLFDNPKCDTHLAHTVRTCEPHD